jgi:hypothetical protein
MPVMQKGPIRAACSYDQACLHSLERHTNAVCAYPNDPAVSDHTIPSDHQLKPIWNVRRVWNFDCGPFGRDV